MPATLTAEGIVQETSVCDLVNRGRRAVAKWHRTDYEVGDVRGAEAANDTVVAADAGLKAAQDFLRALVCGMPEHLEGPALAWVDGLLRTHRVVRGLQ